MQLQNNEWVKNEILKLNDQVHMLHQQINNLKLNENYKNIYEYHLKTINIEKVKGSFQIGQLFEMDIHNEDGIHRFFIDEIKVNEIEGSGTIGIGITEKKGSNKKKSEKVSPEEANEKVKNIYNQIKELLDIQKVPDFFQKLAIKEDVLTEVFETINKEWNSSEPFNQFYIEVKERLQQIDLPDKNFYNQTTENLNKDICKQLSDQLKEDAKVLLVITFLLQGYLPVYLRNFEFKEVNKQKLKVHIKDQEVDVEHYVSAIKAGFSIDQLPLVIEKLKSSPYLFRNIFYLIIQPVAENGQINQYLKDLNLLLVSKTEEIHHEMTIKKLSPDDLSFLISQLMETLDRNSKYTVLIFLFYHLLCANYVNETDQLPVLKTRDINNDNFTDRQTISNKV